MKIEIRSLDIIVIFWLIALTVGLVYCQSGVWLCEYNVGEIREIIEKLIPHIFELS